MITKEKLSIEKNSYKRNLGITELKKAVSLKTFIPKTDIREIALKIVIMIITAFIVIFSPH